MIYISAQIGWSWNIKKICRSQWERVDEPIRAHVLAADLEHLAHLLKEDGKRDSYVIEDGGAAEPKLAHVTVHWEKRGREDLLE